MLILNLSQAGDAVTLVKRRGMLPGREIDPGLRRGIENVGKLLVEVVVLIKVVGMTVTGIEV